MKLKLLLLSFFLAFFTANYANQEDRTLLFNGQSTKFGKKVCSINKEGDKIERRRSTSYIAPKQARKPTTPPARRSQSLQNIVGKASALVNQSNSPQNQDKTPSMRAARSQSLGNRPKPQEPSENKHGFIFLNNKEDQEKSQNAQSEYLKARDALATLITNAKNAETEKQKNEWIKKIENYTEEMKKINNSIKSDE